MSGIIRPDAGDIEDLKNDPEIDTPEKLSRAQRRRLERQRQKQMAALNKPAKMKHVESLRIAIQGLLGNARNTDVSMMALVETLVEQDVLDKELFLEKERELMEKVQQDRRTPNSPAAAEAEEAAEAVTEETGEARKVERLDEVPPTPETATEDESAPRRLVEG